jgi:glycosyltransferase involved in cell wall biosynthesis
MRLAVYSDDVYHRDAGALWATEAFALFLARLAGFADRLVVVGRLAPAAGPAHHRLPDGVALAPLPYYGELTRPLSAVAAWPRSLARFWRTLAGVDAVWLLGPHPLALAFAALAALRRRRVVLGVRQNMPDYVRTRHPGRRAVLALALALEGAWRLAARLFPVVVVGPDLARRYAGGRAVLDIPVSLVDPDDLVDEEDALARSYDGELVALSVGRLDPEKNPLLLADVLARLRERDPRWRLVVCGDGALRDELARRLAALGLDACADLRGYVPLDGGLRELYRSSHVFVHVSWTEGFPQVLLEAFAAGLPVVATDVGGVAALAAGATRLVPPGDADAVADEAALVASDAAERRRLIRAGLERAAEHEAPATCARLAAFIAGTERAEPPTVGALA